jgi:hypothetical protein
VGRAFPLCKNDVASRVVIRALPDEADGLVGQPVGQILSFFSLVQAGDRACGVPVGEHVARRLDPLRCPGCDGTLRILSFLTEGGDPHRRSPPGRLESGD